MLVLLHVWHSAKSSFQRLWGPHQSTLGGAAEFARGKRNLIFLKSCWFWCGLGRIWKFSHAPEQVHVQDELRSGELAVGGEGKVSDLPRGWVEDKADRASEGSVNPTTAEGPLSQGEPLWLGGAERPNHRQWQKRLTELTGMSERDTIATKASKDSEATWEHRSESKTLPLTPRQPSC